jgi:hypothetical protein
MSSLKITTVIILMSALGIMFSSCDDSGVITKNPSNFSIYYLYRVDQQTQGIYEAWIEFPSGNGYIFISCGKFNIGYASNQIVDPSGNPTSLGLKYKPANLYSPICAIIYLEPPGYTDTVPGGTRILGGPASVSGNYITATLNMRYPGVLGEIAQLMPYAQAQYILNTPTTEDTSDYYKGIWFCDLSQNRLLDGVNTIPDSLDWVYQGWIISKTLNPDSAYSLGRFVNASVADSDGAGPYKGPDPGYNKPGQDFVVGAPISNLKNGNFAVMITLEPKNEVPPATNKPFFIKVFYGEISTDLTYGQISGVLGNASATFPAATMNISIK